MNFTRRFQDLSHADVHLAGGKGASLGELTKAGLPVPRGFVVVAPAFERMIEEAGIKEEIEAALSAVRHEVIHTVEHAAEKIQGLIRESVLPPYLEEEIIREFRGLETPFVAVRSSATAEDGAEHAWAGQLESFLNTTEATLMEHIRGCWASLFTPRAIFYRFEKGLQDSAISVAVVVQAMVESEISGIAFSVHPITEDPNQLIIEAGLGLGEAIVSGAVTPDSYVVQKTPRKTLRVTVGEQSRKLIRIEKGGNEWLAVDKQEGGRQFLEEAHIQELTEIILRIEEHYGFPCDIEWALENSHFYIVQSRPITTLSAKPMQTGLAEQFLKNLRGDTPYPFWGSYSPLLIFTSWTDPSLDEDYYTPYTMFVATAGKQSLGLVSEERYKLAARKMVRAVLTGRKSVESLTRSCEPLYASIARLHELIVGVDMSDWPEAKILSALQEASDTLRSILGCTLFIETFDQQMLLEELSGRSIDVAGLWEKATHPAFLSFAHRHAGKKLELLEHYGVRDAAPRARCMYTDYWCPAPLETVERALQELQDKKHDIQRDIEVARTRLVSEQTECTAWLSGLSAKEALVVRYIQYVMEARDLRKDPIAQSQVVLYLCGLELARRADLSRDALLMIPPTELLRGSAYLAEHKDTLERRVEGHAYLMNEQGEIQDAPVDFEATSALLMRSAENHDETLQGQTANNGIARGRVRVVLSVDDSVIFEPGEILVTGMTRPEFVPYMKKAAAVITNEGGITCHAAIVSRELNIPCVIGTKYATQKLKDGDFVEVDAHVGVVRRLQRFAKNDYILAFWAQGVSPFITDVHVPSYEVLEVLFLIDNGMFQQYFTKAAFERALKRGLAFYSDPHAFEAYREDLSRHCRYLEELSRDLTGRREIDRDDLHAFFDAIVKLCGDYTKMNFEFTDRAFLHQEENAVIKRNLEGVARFKDEVRAVMNATLFEPEAPLYKLWGILAEQFCLPPEIFEHLTRREILDLYDGKRPDGPVMARAEAFVQGFGIDGCIEGAEATPILEEFRNQPETLTTLSGQGACGGKARGRVHVIAVDYGNLEAVHREMEAMEEGAILVAETTAPELMMACRKAAAIVTDMGGLMSHAAIVSREFGIPCVVGTEMATRVLKNGDEVEVDGDLGIIAFR